MIGKELRGKRGSEVWRQATANTARLWLWNNGRVHLQCKNGSNTQRKMLDESKLRQISHIIYIKNITYKKEIKTTDSYVTWMEIEMGNSPMSSFEEEKYQIQSSNNRKSASVFQVDDQQFLEKRKKTSKIRHDSLIMVIPCNKHPMTQPDTFCWFACIRRYW